MELSQILTGRRRSLLHRAYYCKLIPPWKPLQSEIIRKASWGKNFSTIPYICKVWLHGTSFKSCPWRLSFGWPVPEIRSSRWKIRSFKKRMPMYYCTYIESNPFLSLSPKMGIVAAQIPPPPQNYLLVNKLYNLKLYYYSCSAFWHGICYGILNILFLLWNIAPVIWGRLMGKFLVLLLIWKWIAINLLTNCSREPIPSEDEVMFKSTPAFMCTCQDGRVWNLIVLEGLILDHLKQIHFLISHFRDVWKTRECILYLQGSYIET